MTTNREATRKALQQRWLRSTEEDTDAETVFRPAAFRFPPARGRIGFELKSDGTAVDVGIAPTDAWQETAGTWELGGEAPFYIVLRFPSGERRVMQIARVEEDRLVITK